MLLGNIKFNALGVRYVSDIFKQSIEFDSAIDYLLASCIISECVSATVREKFHRIVISIMLYVVIQNCLSGYSLGGKGSIASIS
jgi:hypothetical protein